jgi:hypothetical protein
MNNIQPGDMDVSTAENADIGVTGSDPINDIHNDTDGSALGGEIPERDKYDVLMERIDKNYTDFNDALVNFSKNELIDMAWKISSVYDCYMAMYSALGDKELDFLLQFQNPLEVIADSWRKQNSYLDGMSDFIYNLSEDKTMIDRFPLMKDAETDLYIDPDAPVLHRYMDVDLIAFLGKIAEKVIIHYPNDFNIDIDRLYRAASSHEPDEKRLMWHVCSYGTHINTERETFIRDTGAYNTWVGYRHNEPDMFGYAIEVTGRKGHIVTGNVFEVGDYYPHSLYVRDKALRLEAVTLSYTNEWGVNAGKTITVPRYEYDSDRNRLCSKSGDVQDIEYIPYEGVRDMDTMLRQERARHMSYPIGSEEAHIQALTDKLTEIREVIPFGQEEHGALAATVGKAEPDVKPWQAGVNAKPEQTGAYAKPRTLQEKLQAANEKARTQDASNGCKNTHKKGERG